MSTVVNIYHMHFLAAVLSVGWMIPSSANLVKDGDVNKVQMIFSEKGDKNTDLTYKSIMAAVAKLQPKGYETFAKEFTELKEMTGEGYKVIMGLDKDIASEHELTVEEGRSYVTIVFEAAE